MRDPERLLLFLIFGLILFFSYQLVQGLFDDADVRKSINIVQNYPAYGEPKLVEVLKERHQGEQEGPVQWSGEVSNTIFGHVVVHADVRLKKGNTVRYDFGVNLTTVSIHPANAHGEEVLQALSRARPASRPSSPEGNPTPP